MAKNQIPIVKLSRRLGIVLGKEKYVRRRAYPPGAHGPKFIKSKPRLSSYGEQLQEKQKAKAVYGLLEKQFRKYMEKALNSEGNTAEVVMKLLEQRLDNVIYRMGFAITRRQARQLVSHGFILVNNKLVDIPSYQVHVGDIIGIKENKKTKTNVVQLSENKKTPMIPKWISSDSKTLTGKITGTPETDDYEKVFDPRLIVEFYSR